MVTCWPPLSSRCTRDESGDQVPMGSEPMAWPSSGREASEARKCRMRAPRTPLMVAMCSREQTSLSLGSRDLGECSGGVPGGVRFGSRGPVQN